MHHRFTVLVENGLAAGVSLTVGQDSVTLIGRAPDAALRLPPEERTVSREHCVLDIASGVARVKNLQKPSRTLVNDQPVDGVSELQPGDRLTIGRVVLRLIAMPVDPPTEVEATQKLTLADVEEVPEAPAHELAMPGPTETHAAAMGPSFEEMPVPRASGCDLCGVLDQEPVDPDYATSPWLCADCAQSRRVETRSQGARIARYEIFEKIGEGGMGIVYEGIDVASAVRVAVKVLRSDIEPTEREIQRFVREQGIAITLRHPNIVRTFQVGIDDSVFFIATEFVAGGDANKLIGVAPDGEILQLGVDLFRALDHAHDHGVVHRDVKPANLLVTNPRARMRRGRLMDFGLAKNVRDMNRAVTVQGEAGGTLSMMAPEQLLDFASANRSADLYAGAATLFRLLTGTDAIVLPDGHDTRFGTIAGAVLAPARQSLQSLRPDLPAPLCARLDALLTRDHTYRAGLRARDVAAALEEWIPRVAES